MAAQVTWRALFALGMAPGYLLDTGAERSRIAWVSVGNARGVSLSSWPLNRPSAPPRDAQPQPARGPSASGQSEGLCLLTLQANSLTP